MKKVIILLSLAVLVTACASLQESQAWELTKDITYINDYDQKTYDEDYWQTPEETKRLKKADCDDFAILHYFDRLSRGEKPVFVYGKRFNVADSDHLWLESNGWTYSNHRASSGNLKGYYVLKRFTHLDKEYIKKIRR